MRKKGHNKHDGQYSSKHHKITLHRRTQKVEEEVLPLRPEPIGKPEVWAQFRQELCEGLPYFRSYQGGIYFRNGVVFGYLLDGFGAERDYMGSHVVISHG